jgi:hypothetical protein
MIKFLNNSERGSITENLALALDMKGNMDATTS